MNINKIRQCFLEGETLNNKFSSIVKHLQVEVSYIGIVETKTIIQADAKQNNFSKACSKV